MTRVLAASACALSLALGGAALRAQHPSQVLGSSGSHELGSGVSHFKYGSVGIEPEEGLPYWIWQVLPRLFADKLPGGYASLGFLWEPGQELPVGFSKKDVWGSSRVAINCAFCHTATYRTSASSARTLVPGGASSRLNPQAYSRFLEAAAADPRFNASDMLAAIDQIGVLSFTERLVYRLALIPGTRRALQRHKTEFSWMDTRPDWGPGRIDPLNPFKFRQLAQPVDDTIGNADMTPLWRLGLRDGRALHWDGLNSSVEEVLVSSAIGNGASVKSVDLDGVARVGDWLRDLAPPRYPFPIDAALAATGSGIFARECGACHGETGSRMGQVIALDEIGTDPHRLNAWTASSAAAFNAYATGKAWQFHGFRKTAGYVAAPLAGVWLNAPYLHNGAVPSLQDLLAPEPDRPRRFVRGYDVYDPVRVGFVSSGPAAESAGQLFDASLPGNGNAGHRYGTLLAAPDKAALIEFLKTQ
jgi:hypothetical protein